MAFVQLTSGKDDIYVATKKGRGIRFNEEDARAMGRTAGGVRAIKVGEGDEVVAMEICHDDSVLLTVTETGYGRKTPISDYRRQSRGGKGTTNYHTERFGNVAHVISVTEEQDVIMIASDGVIIRVPVAEISTFSRPAKGVRVMRLDASKNAKLLSIATADHDEQEVTDLPEAADPNDKDNKVLGNEEEITETAENITVEE